MSAVDDGGGPGPRAHGGWRMEDGLPVTFEVEKGCSMVNSCY